MYKIACEKKENKAKPTINLPASSRPLPVIDCDSGSETAEHPFEDKLNNKCKIFEEEQDESADNSMIEVKLDTVIGMLKNLSTKIGQTKSPIPELSLVVKELSTDKDLQI